MAINNEFDRSANREVVSDRATSDNVISVSAGAGAQVLPGVTQDVAPSPEVVLVAQASVPATDAAPEQVVVEMAEGNIARLPEGADISQPRQNGANLEFVQPDGTVIVIPNGAVQGLTLFIGAVEIPPQTVAQLFAANGIEAAAGPEGGAEGSHGNFGWQDPGGIGDGLGYGDLLPPTELFRGLPDFEQLLGVNSRPTFGGLQLVLGGVSDEGLAFGNLDEAGSDDTTNSATLEGQLAVNDPDGDPLQFVLGIPAIALKSGGVDIVWDASGENVLIGRAGGVEIIRITITEGRTADGGGHYLVELKGPIDHPIANVEDQVTLNIPITVSDGQGGSDTSTLVLTIEDDSPILTDAPEATIVNGDFTAPGDFTQQHDWGGADNDGVTGWIVEGPQVERVNDGYLGMHTSNGAPMIDMAASPGNITLSQEVSGLVNGQTYAIQFEAGAPVPDSAVLEVYWGGELIGTINPSNAMTSYNYVVTATGNAALDKLTFKEVGNSSSDPVGNGIPGTHGLHGTYLANVGIVAAAIVDEDGLAGGNAGGVGDVEGAATQATGILGIKWGADNGDLPDVEGVQDSFGRAVYFTDASVAYSGASALTSLGENIEFRLENNGTRLVGYVAGYGEGEEAGAERVVFTVSLSDDGSGSFVFTLLGQLDHAAGGDENDITLTFDFTARDFDGDTVGGKFAVAVDDDSPVQLTGEEAPHVSATVLEDGISASMGDAGDKLEGNRENGETTSSDEASGLAGSLTSLIKVGADGPATFSVNFDLSGLPNLYSHGQPVTYSVLGNVLTATGVTGTVFTLTVNSDGSWSFDLDGQLDHVAGSGENFALRSGEGSVSAIDFSSIITVTDFDGDKLVGLSPNSFTIAVQDDVPVATGASLVANNLIVNGSFELGAPPVNGEGWAITGAVPGWTNAQGGALFEIQQGNIGGQNPQDGNYKVELDGDRDGGLENTNATVQQTISGTEAGQTYVLTFWYSPRPGSEGSSGMEVRFGGNLVHEITSENAGSGWQKITIVVTADGPNAVLSFTGTGAADEFGAYLDNVSLSPIQTVDENDIFNVLSTGSSPFDDADGSVSAFNLLGLGFAAKVTGSLAASVSFGADGPAASNAFALTGDAASTLTALGLTSKGGAIVFTQVGNVVYGYVDNGNGHADIFDRPVMALALNTATGDYEFRLFDQVDHVADAVNAENTGLQHDGEGVLNAIDFGSIIKATDGDGDSIVLDGQLLISIKDDVPSLAVTLDNTVRIDETPGKQNSDVTDVAAAAAIKQFFVDHGVVGATDVSLGAPIFARNDVVDFSTAPGADEPVTVTMALAVTDPNSGLYTTDGKAITLSLNAQGVVVGTFDGGKVAFALSIDNQGQVTIAQYVSLRHGDVGSADDSIDLTGKVSAVVSATDYDGDTVTKTVAIGDHIAFDDDGPTLVAGSVEVRSIYENDINTHWSHGTSPSDGNGEGGPGNGSYTDSWSGAAYITGSLANLVNFGADGAANTAFSFTTNWQSYLTSLHLFSKETALPENGQELVYTRSGNVITAWEPDTDGWQDTSNPVFRLTINADGTYKFELFDELIHKAGNGENTELRSGNNGATIDGIDFGKIIQATDGDGDTVTLDGKFVIKVVDDVPVADIDLGRASVVHDESSGTQYDADDTTSNSVKALFAGVANAGQALGYARSDGAVVYNDSAIGADSPALSQQFSLAIVDAASGLKLTDGSSITLMQEGNLIVGRVDTGADAGKAAFAISIDQSGYVSIAQYLSLEHDNTHSSNETINLAGKINAVLTVTDSDGDTVSDSIGIGSKIGFRDDGPSVEARAYGESQVTLTTHDAATPGTGSETVTANFASLFSAQINYGADGAGGSPTWTYALQLASYNGVDSGLGSNGSDIRLFLVNGVIYGSTTSNINHAQSQAVFKIEVDATGTVTLTQYREIDHSYNHDTASPYDDQLASLANGFVKLVGTVTVTDGDGDTDTSSATIDLGGNIRFADDGPSVVAAVAGDGNAILTTYDHDTVGYSSDVASFNFGNLFSVSSSSFGADGPGNTSWSYGLSITGTPVNGRVDSGLNSDGNNIYLYNIQGVIYGSTSTSGQSSSVISNAVFKIVVSSNGTVTLTQYEAIDHANNSDTSAPYDDQFANLANGLIKLTGTVTITDGDGDSASSSASIDLGGNVRFADDGPSVSLKVSSDSNVVLKTYDADTIGAASDTDTANFGNLFSIQSPSYGADGQGATTWSYGFNLLGGDGTDSGQKSNGDTIRLYLIDGQVVGSTAGSLGAVSTANTIFALQVSGSGVVKLIQYAEIDHSGGSSSNYASQYASLANNLVQIVGTVTITDSDGDKASASKSIDLGGNVRFYDDGPAVSVSATDNNSVVLTTQDADTIGAASDTAVSTANFGNVFQANTNYGADGAGHVEWNFGLGISSQGLQSNLVANGLTIRLYSDNGVVYGSTATSAGARNDANTIFKVEVDATGKVTLTQFSQIQHPVGSDLVTLAGNLITLTGSATVTDGDGDTATHSKSIDLGGNIAFADDGPTASNYVGETFAENSGAHDLGLANSLLAIDAGADGLKSVTFGTGSQGGTLSIDGNGHLVYTPPASVSSTTTVTETFSYTVEDGDGDKVVKQITFGVSDSGVTMGAAPTALVVDEDDIAGAHGNSGGPGDLAQTTTGHLAYTLGGDALQSVALSVASTGLTTIAGHNVSTSWDAATKTLTGYGADASDVVFTIKLSNVTNTGADYTIELLQPVVHPDHANSDPNAPVNFEDNLSFDVLATVTDADGSTGTATIAVTINDDAVYMSDYGVHPTFDEGSGAHDLGVAKTLLEFSAGADGQASLVFHAGDKGGTLSIDQNGHLIYTAPANIAGTGTVVETIAYTLTDKDGDSVTRYATINVANTGVTMGAAPADLVIDEDDINATGNAGGAGDVSATTTTGHLAYTLGVDPLQSVVLSVATTGLVKLDGVTAIQTTWDDTTKTLIGYGINPSDVVFKIALSSIGTTGADYTITLFQPVSHPGHDADGANDGPETAYEDNVSFNVLATVTDIGGSSGTAGFTVTINDDSPTAVNDTDSVAAGSFTAATGNVITDSEGDGGKDATGADGAMVSQVYSAHSGTTEVNSASTVVVGEYGVLTISFDGSYSYARNAGTPGGVSDVFTYTLKDGDGDTATATLTIDIGNATPTFTVPAAGGETTSVYEAGLPARGLEPEGTGEAIQPGANGDTRESVSGTIAFSSPDGLTQVSLNGVALTTSLTVISDTIQGTLSAMYSYGANGEGQISYVYTLKDNTSGEGTSVSFAVAVEDADGDTSAAGNLVINIVDDAPQAFSDVAMSVLETAGATNGTNLLANDHQGADGATVTAVDFGLGLGFQAISASGTTTFTNANGTYTFKADGAWTFDPVINASNSDTTGSFTYRITDGDGDEATASQVVNIQNANSLPTAGTTSATLDDDGLANGNPGGTNDLTGGSPESVATGTLPHDYNVDGKAAADPISFSTMNGTSGMVGTEQVTYSWDAATNTLTAASGARGSIFTVKVDGGVDNGNGNYTVTLLKPVLHEPGQDENDAQVSLTYTVKDSNNDTTNGTLNLTFNDDTPVAHGETAEATAGAVQKVDAVFIVDVSGSMNDDYINVPGTDLSNDRIGLARYSMLQLINNSAQLENILIIRFDGAGRTGVWMNKADAIAFINNDSNWNLGNNGTNYDAALSTTMNAFDGTRPSAVSPETAVYFLSDGEPSSGGGITNDGSGSNVSINEWETFVSDPANKIGDVFAVGIGPDVSVSALSPVSYPNTDADANGREDHVILVPDQNDVSGFVSTLQNAIGTAASVEGNVLSNDSFGADGGYIQSITVNGVVYTFNGSNNVAESGSTPSGYVDHGTWIEVPTAMGGKLTFYFATTGAHAAGEWSYLAPTNVGGVETFNYVLRDGDGDTAGASLTVNVTKINELPTTTSAAASGAENTAIAVLLTGADPDGTVAAFVISSLPTNGTLMYNGTELHVGDLVPATGNQATIQFVPNANYFGSQTFQFAAQDNSGGVDATPATATITVTDTPPVPGIDNIITNAGVGNAFLVPEWAMLANDTNAGNQTLDITATSNNNGVTTNLATNPGNVTIVDTNPAGGTFSYTVSNGTTSAIGSATVSQDTVGIIDGTSGNDIIVAGPQTVSQVTKITFASSYDAGDVVSISVNGKTYSYEVPTGGKTGEQVYDALRGTSVGGVTLGNSLASAGVTWANDLTAGAVVLSGNAGQTFEVTSAISNGAAQPWVYRVDFNNVSTSSNSFDGNDIVSITINGTTYSSDGSNSGGNSRALFDNAQASLLQVLTAAGFTVTNDPGSDSFDITINQNSSISGRVVVDNSNAQTVSASVVTTGSSPSDQAAPAVETHVGTPQQTTVAFASSYDAGDVVSLTVNGTTFSYTVPAGGQTADEVYDALKAVSVGSLSLAEALASSGVNLPADLGVGNSVVMTGYPGVTFALTAAVDNSADVNSPWVHTVSFTSNPSGFNSGETISITINDGTPHTYSATSSGGSGSDGRFDNAAAHLVSTLNGVSGVHASYDPGSNTFTITTSYATTLTATSQASNQGNPSVHTEAGSIASDQSNPSVTTIAATTDTGFTLDGHGGNDILIGSGGDDFLIGGDGNDILFGGAGFDTLTGGTGADTFKLGNLDAADLITDYSGVGGEGDKIDLTGLFNAGSGNVSDFVHYNETTGVLSVDTNGTSGGASFVDVATLGSGGHPAASTVTIIFEDANGIHEITANNV
ncbi:T1SS secreted agglutinin RTX [Devosia sp. H5989]|nr:T1SS secreted agglutinin RTX [Devosia sp. H5989]